ncbi:MAG: MFS transporter [Acidobacteriaceae bacterium]|nr:MFS transporter [Acidobacteriaceae bacterium]
MNLANPPKKDASNFIRWRTLSLITLVAVVTYLDRLNISIAGKYIQKQFLFSTQTMGWIFSAFLLGYALFQLPGGWAGDRFGPRKVLTGALLSWSVLTAATAIAPHLVLVRWVGVAWSFAVVRFLIGVGEAASSPNMNKVVGNWIGSGHRGKASSFSILGIGIGGSVTPPLISWMVQHWGWQTSFAVCGAMGLVVALLWYKLVSDRPQDSPEVSASESAPIPASAPAQGELRPSPPWRRMLSNPSTWGLVLGYMCQGFPIYFFHTWFFIYLVDVRHWSVTKGSFWGAAPYIAIATLAPIGGWFSDAASRHLGRRRGRRAAVWMGMGGSALCLWLGSALTSSIWATLFLAAGAGLNMFAATTFWATSIDLAPDYAGSLSGLMNTFGNFGGWLSPIISAFLATHYGWNRALLCTSVVTIASGLLFSMVDAESRVDLVASRASGPAAARVRLPSAGTP